MKIDQHSVQTPPKGRREREGGELVGWGGEGTGVVAGERYEIFQLKAPTSHLPGPFVLGITLAVIPSLTKLALSNGTAHAFHR